MLMATFPSLMAATHPAKDNMRPKQASLPGTEEIMRLQPLLKRLIAWLRIPLALQPPLELTLTILHLGAQEMSYIRGNSS